MITLGYFAEKKAKVTFCLDDVQPVLCNDGELGHERLDPLLRGVGQQTQHFGRRRLQPALAADARARRAGAAAQSAGTTRPSHSGSRSQRCPWSREYSANRNMSGTK